MTAPALPPPIRRINDVVAIEEDRHAHRCRRCRCWKIQRDCCPRKSRRSCRRCPLFHVTAPAPLPKIGSENEIVVVERVDDRAFRADVIAGGGTHEAVARNRRVPAIPVAESPLVIAPLPLPQLGEEDEVVGNRC